ncbi:Protein sel-1-like protein [Smittium mucronatum]|uniref:Protein sel-1-like protein n=1 Tax=Smittium mucronatum TaxID=133383 RepID=A0A1R0GVR5_9FUNG|nr:Protein sel-1-like protein [Smittium mucronatum]
MIREYEKFRPFAFSKFVNSKTTSIDRGILKNLYNTIFKDSEAKVNKFEIKDNIELKNKRILDFAKTLPKSLKESHKILHRMADEGDEEALMFLAEFELYGKGGFPMDLRSSFSRYEKLSENYGNAEAQFMMAIFYSTGLAGVQKNSALVHVYLNMASLQDHTKAQIMLADRYYRGIGVSQDCKKSINLVQQVSKKSMKYYYSGPPLGRKLPKSKRIVYSKKGGIYGVRTSSKSIEIKEKTKKEAIGIVEFYKFKVTKRDFSSHMALYQIYSDGLYHVDQDSIKAAKHIIAASKLVFLPGSTKLRNPDLAADKKLPYLFEYLGRIYLHGEGVKKDYKEALKWFKAGADMGFGSSYNALGLMYYDGFGVEKDYVKSIDFFKKAAEKNNSEGYVYYGLALSETDPSLSSKYFYEAMKENNFRAFYYYADLFKNTASFDDLCQTFNNYYRQVVYFADWEYSPTPLAESAMNHGAYDSALVAYIIAAELGYKAGISNSAYLLEKYTQRFDLRKYSGYIDLLQISKIDSLAAAYWVRGANAGVLDCRLKQGDYYYYGKGVEENKSKAAAAYMLSAEIEENEMAMWNLAYMYEFGIGVKRDFHLAKRWYDRSLEGYKSGVLAVGYSICRLAISYYISKMRGEDVGVGPLFMAPPPKAEPKTPFPNSKNPTQKNSGVEKGINKDGKGNAKYNFEEDEKSIEQNVDDIEENNRIIASGSFTDFHLIIALCLLLGYLILIRNRRVGQNNARNAQVVAGNVNENNNNNNNNNNENNNH